MISRERPDANSDGWTGWRRESIKIRIHRWICPRWAMISLLLLSCGFDVRYDGTSISMSYAHADNVDRRADATSIDEISISPSWEDIGRWELHTGWTRRRSRGRAGCTTKGKRSCGRGKLGDVRDQGHEGGGRRCMTKNRSLGDGYGNPGFPKETRRKTDSQ